MKYQPEEVPEDHPLAGLYQRYAASILAYLDWHVPVKEDAEDLLLEVFLAALENRTWQRLQEGEQLAWLRRVARNKLVDHYRHATRHPATPLQDIAEPYEDETRMPEQIALRHESQQLLQRKIATLPGHQQEILHLRFAYGLHTKEIALMLKKTDNAVRLLLSRTLNQLRRSYEQHKGEQGHGPSR